MSLRLKGLTTHIEFWQCVKSMRIEDLEVFI